MVAETILRPSLPPQIEIHVCIFGFVINKLIQAFAETTICTKLEEGCV